MSFFSICENFYRFDFPHENHHVSDFCESNSELYLSTSLTVGCTPVDRFHSATSYRLPYRRSIWNHRTWLERAASVLVPEIPILFFGSNFFYCRKRILSVVDRMIYLLTARVRLGHPWQMNDRLETGRRMEQITNQGADVRSGFQSGDFNLILFRFQFIGSLSFDWFLQLFDVSANGIRTG